jgi:uncharacterized membrane protein YsdA (DUF1294 family)
MSPVRMIGIIVAILVIILSTIFYKIFNLLLPSYLLSINLIAFCIFGWDKRQAIGSRFRIPNLVFNLVAICGGSLGSIIGLYAFRHKTLQSYFKLSLFFYLAIHVAIIYFLFWMRSAS